MTRHSRGRNIGRMGAVSTLSFCIASTAAGFLLAHRGRVQASTAASTSAAGSEVKGGGDVSATVCSAGEGGEVWCGVSAWRYSPYTLELVCVRDTHTPLRIRFDPSNLSGSEGGPLSLVVFPAFAAAAAHQQHKKHRHCVKCVLLVLLYRFLFCLKRRCDGGRGG